MSNDISLIAQELGLSRNHVSGVVELLEDGATIPFIARYRKEKTGSLDEVIITDIRDLLKKHQALTARRDTILANLSEKEQLSPSLKQQITEARTLTELEDLYLPYRPRRQTKATKAREAGLEPLAHHIFTGKPHDLAIESFIDQDKGISSTETAILGACDIIAEWISEHGPTRTALRQLFMSKGQLSSRLVSGKEEAGQKYLDFFQWEELARSVPGHRLLAMLRGEREKILSLSLRPPKEAILDLLHRLHRGNQRWQERIEAAIADCSTRLLGPTMERELRKQLLEAAEDDAIAVFAGNLRQLLLAPPLRARSVLALDPGFRTGAKLACLDQHGELLDWTTIYPTHGGRMAEEAATTMKRLVATHSIEAIAIGNKTAARETEQFVRSLEFPASIIIAMVNEDGASIYSASEVARREFPELDITVRGAISIGRRLQDPLAELVKIDPKSIGVGQYQHDLDHRKMEQALADTIMFCVNSVGVELNNASVELLSHVAGLNRNLAENIVSHRSVNGPFSSRRELLKVKKLGPKTYEQCAGFLRIRGGKEPLDASGVHPERYPLVRQIAKDLHCSVRELLDTPGQLVDCDLSRYTDDKVGMETLHDIVAELKKPGRDPRENFSVFRFDDTIQKISDLQEGMCLPAVITNITRFGAFADIGIKENGLIHISQLADRFVRDPGEVVKLGQQVQVRVVNIDLSRKRIGLSLRLS